MPKISFKICQVLNLILCFQVEYPMYWTYGEWTEGFRWLVGYLKLDEVGVYISERTKRIQKGDWKITPFANKILCFGNDYHQSYPGEGKGFNPVRWYLYNHKSQLWELPSKCRKVSLFLLHVKKFGFNKWCKGISKSLLPLMKQLPSSL